jgi:hypothetical protein
MTISSSPLSATSTGERKSLAEVLTLKPSNKEHFGDMNLLSSHSFPEMPNLTPRVSGENPNPSGVIASTPAQQFYRVMVETTNSNQQTEVRSLYPDAIATQYNGQAMLQVGTFSNRDNAEETLQSLQNLGLKAVIIQ